MTNQLLLSLTTGIFIGGVAGYLGTLMVIKRMSVAVDPLSHLVLPGIALALLFHFDVSLGALFSIVLGMILIWFLELKTKLSTETLIAVVFTLGVAFALLILPEAEIEEIFVGDISKINFLSTIISAILSIIIFLQIITDVKWRENKDVIFWAPIAWLVFYFVDFIEYVALVKSIIKIIKNKTVAWQKWERVGVFGA